MLVDPVTVRTALSNVRLASSSNSPPVPAMTILLFVRSSTLADAASIAAPSTCTSPLNVVKPATLVFLVTIKSCAVDIPVILEFTAVISSNPRSPVISNLPRIKTSEAKVEMPT